MNILGVQIIGGILAILSGVILVLFFAKLDELISRHYLEIFKVNQNRNFMHLTFKFKAEITRGTLTWMAGFIVLAIMVNILVILGGSGGRWRRGLLLPWLLFYGFVTVGCLVTHLYFTSLCWREEKVSVVGILDHPPL